MLNISKMVLFLFEPNTTNMHYLIKRIMIKNMIKNKFSMRKITA